MSGTVNIRRDVNDSFYRYKMPRLISKIEGKGNGIKTVIPNMSEIAKALARPATYPTKFFGCELGAQVKFELDKDRYIVNGAHDASKLQGLLDTFIQKFVLCGACGNPETDLFILKDGDIMRNCVACGQQTLVDMRHKLVTFILKNPPQNSAESKLIKQDKKASGRKSKKGKKDDSDDESAMATSKDTLDDSFDGEEDEEADEDADNEEMAKRIDQEAAALSGPIQSQLEDWSTPEHQEDGMGGLSEGMARRLNLVEDGEDDPDASEDPFEMLATFVEDLPRDKLTAATVVAEIDRLALRADKAVAVLFQVVFDDQVLDQLPKHADLFRTLIAKGNEEKGQKAVLGGLERLVGVSFPDQLMNKVPLILKTLYDCDVCEEEVILAWAAKPSKKYVSKDVSKEIRKKAEPFITWLQTAEEEEESD